MMSALINYYSIEQHHAGDAKSDKPLVDVKILNITLEMM